MKSTEITNFTPKQFVAEVKSLKSKIKTLKRNSKKNIYSTGAKLRKLQAELNQLNQAYLIKKFSGNKLYVDKLELNGKTFNFANSFNICAEERENNVKTNGGQNKIKKEIFIVVTNEAGAQYEDKILLADLSSTKDFVNQVKETVYKYPKDKNNLDTKVVKVKEQIWKEEAATNKKVALIRGDSDSKRKGVQEKLDQLMKNATREQLKVLNRPKRVMIILASVALCVIGSAVIFQKISNHRTIAAEENRAYYINTNDSYTFDCNGVYDKESRVIKCTDRKIAGDFSKYESVGLQNNTSDSLDVKDNKFAIDLDSPSIDKNNYQTDRYNVKKIEKGIKSTDIKLNIYNNILNRSVAQKEIKINWKFTQGDIKLLNTKNIQWAKEQAKQKAEEAVRQATQEAEEKKSSFEENVATTCRLYAKNNNSAIKVPHLLSYSRNITKHADGITLNMVVYIRNGGWGAGKTKKMMECKTDPTGYRVIYLDIY